MPAALHGQRRGHFIPDDLSIRLRAFVPPPREETLASLPEPVPTRAGLPLVVAETEEAAMREIFSVLQLVDRGGVPVSAVLAENPNKTNAIRHRRRRGLRLWTSVSGFKSLPPSQIH